MILINKLLFIFDMVLNIFSSCSSLKISGFLYIFFKVMIV